MTRASILSAAMVLVLAATTALARSEDLLRAARDSRSTLGELLPLLERDEARAAAAVETYRALYAQGAATAREIDTAERALADARAKADETRRAIEGVDALIAEAEAAETAPRLPAPPERHPAAGVITRYAGAGGWSLYDVARVKVFFAARFGRPLPVSAFGQTALHDRLGFDHRNSVDVGLHPDSPEGQALVAYLRGAGIPFLAFRSAVPGKATGAHIHIGYPSHRL